MADIAEFGAVAEAQVDDADGLFCVRPPHREFVAEHVARGGVADTVFLTKPVRGLCRRFFWGGEIQMNSSWFSEGGRRCSRSSSGQDIKEHGYKVAEAADQDEYVKNGVVEFDSFYAVQDRAHRIGDAPRQKPKESFAR